MFTRLSPFVFFPLPPRSLYVFRYQFTPVFIPPSFPSLQYLSSIFPHRHVHQFTYRLLFLLTCLPVYLPCFLFPPTCIPVYSPCLLISFPSPTCLPVYPPCLFLSLPPPPPPRHVYQFIYHVSSSLQHFTSLLSMFIFSFPSPTCLPVYPPCLFLSLPPRHVYQFIYHVFSSLQHVYQFTLHVYYFFPSPTCLPVYPPCLFLSLPPPPSPTCLPVYLPCFLFPLTCLPVYSSCLLFFFPSPTCLPVYPPCLFLSLPPPPFPDMFTSLSTMFPIPSNMFTSLLSMFIISFPSPTCLPVYPPCLFLTLPPPPP